MTDTDAGDLAPADPRRRRNGVRWKAVVGIAGLAGLAIAAATTADDASEQALPGAGPLAGALVLYLVGMVFAGLAWVTLFPAGSDRWGIAAGLYTSQLTKYLPAGGFVQVASQVALSSQGGMASAALRLPVFSLGFVVAGSTLGSAAALDDDLPGWGRALAGLALLTLVTLDRRVLAAVLRTVRRVIHRVPEPDDLPPQRAILQAFGCAVANMALFAAAFVLLLGDLADIEPLPAGAALAAGWAAGYVVVFMPSGLLVREAVLVAALPGLAAGSLLAASVAHRLVGLVAEVALAAGAHLAVLRSRRHSPKDADDGDSHAESTALPRDEDVPHHAGGATRRP